MFPIINIGPLAIQSAGLILVMSFFVGIWLSSKLADGIGTHTDAIENILLISLVTGILGARIGFMLQNPAVMLNKPLNLLSLTPSMLDASFGVLVGVLTAIILAQKKHLPLWPTLDTLAPFFLLIYAGIHLANYANGNAFGVPTELPWGIQLWNAVRHPVQLYALILAAALLTWLLVRTRILKWTGFMRSGLLFGHIMTGMALSTLLIRAFSAEKLLLGRFDLIQLFAFLVFLAGLGLIFTRTYPAHQKVGVIISLGSNLDPQVHLAKARERINNEFRLRRTSSLYLTEDVLGNPQTADFLNQVVEIETALPFPDLFAQLKAMELALGREPGNKKSVSLDLDILTYGNEVFITGEQRIPAPNMSKYRYIALPIAEILPGFRHPANGFAIHDILEKMKDGSRVTLISEVENGITG